MSSIELFLLLIGWMIATASPGPATISIIGTAMQSGRTVAVSQVFGILTGGAFWGISAAAGVGLLMQANVWVFELLRYVGAVYLFYLALRSFRKFLIKANTNIEASKDTNNRVAYMRGLLINLTNPKAILQWSALYVVVVPQGATVLVLGTVFLVLFLSGGAVYFLYALILSNPTAVSMYQRFSIYLEAAFAAFFGFAAFKILTSKVGDKIT